MHADTSVGAWMLLFNATFFEDRRLCHSACDFSAVAVLYAGCTGLCKPVTEMRALHKQQRCRDETLAEPHVAGAGAADALEGLHQHDGLAAGTTVVFSQEGVDTATQAGLGTTGAADEAAAEEEALWLLPQSRSKQKVIFKLMQQTINAPWVA
jgi:hypothetical protein